MHTSEIFEAAGEVLKILCKLINVLLKTQPDQLFLLLLFLLVLLQAFCYCSSNNVVFTTVAIYASIVCK